MKDNPFIQTERRIQAADLRILQIERRMSNTTKELKKSKRRFQLMFLASTAYLLILTVFKGYLHI